MSIRIYHPQYGYTGPRAVHGVGKLDFVNGVSSTASLTPMQVGQLKLDGFTLVDDSQVANPPGDMPVLVADIQDGTTPAGAALKAAYVGPLPTPGTFTYNADGTVAADPDGNTYTWNADGTPATQTKGGVTRTFNWNADGTLASVS